MTVESRPHVGEPRRPQPRATLDAAAAKLAFRDLPAVHVASSGFDGSPHVVPLWFVWLEEAIYLTSREGSQVATNLLRDPRVALAFDRGLAWGDHAGVLVNGRAQFVPPDHSGAKRALSAWFVKYREHLSGTGFAAYADEVERPLIMRVRPERLAWWGRPLGPRT